MINESILRKIQQTILGDINAKIERGCFRPIVGIETLHKNSNDNGEKTNICKMSIVVSSTYCPQKNIHKNAYTVRPCNRS